MYEVSREATHAWRINPFLTWYTLFHNHTARNKCDWIYRDKYRMSCPCIKLGSEEAPQITFTHLWHSANGRKGNLQLESLLPPFDRRNLTTYLFILKTSLSITRNPLAITTWVSVTTLVLIRALKYANGIDVEQMSALSISTSLTQITRGQHKETRMINSAIQAAARWWRERCLHS